MTLNHSNERISTIVVFRTCGLGDFILSIPAFGELRKRFPNAQIVLLTMSSTNAAIAGSIASYAGGEMAAPWIKLLPENLVNRVIVLPNLRSPKAIFKASRALRELKPDLIVQMMDIGTPWRRRFKKLGFAALLMGLRRQVGWRHPGAIEAGHIPRLDPHLPHHVHGPLQFMHELFGPSSYTASELSSTLAIGDDARQWADQWFAAHGAEGRWVAIAPGSVHPHKDWPLENFEKVVAEMLHSWPDVRVLVSGTKAEVDKAKRLVALDPNRVFAAAGGVSIAQSAALFERCALVIGNDGGAMHLADAAGARVISIVPGLEFPNSIEPWHNIDRAIRHPMPCAPCYSFTSCPQGHSRCMKDLPVADVMTQVHRAIAEIEAA